MASPGKKSYPLRIDPSLWEQLQRLAANDLRSVNAEIEFLLREALARRGAASASPRHSSRTTGASKQRGKATRLAAAPCESCDRKWCN
ncbi:hypothetical protein [Massilia sp.]|uniref:hypothetical protein n=1 Tax=Massilia sp. TaxID=1882437 RepID=UPI000ECB3074|nr:hypothetical protein [Massilia sp.]HBZ06751.1 toxin-antitoxin system HicB family antitoxin [Massilia sp.]